MSKLKRSRRPYGFSTELDHTFKGGLTPILLTLFQKYKRGEHSEIPFMKSVLTQYQNQLKTQQKYNYRTVFPMSRDVKILKKKILANYI